MNTPFRRTLWTLTALAAVMLAATPATHARVTKIVIDKKVSPAFALKEGGFQSYGTAGQYETIAGRAYGELEAEFALSRQQMADLVRGVTARLRTRLRELLDEEGHFGDDAIDEIVRLLT